MKKYTALTDVKSVLSILSKIPFLEGLSDAQRDAILRLLEFGHFKKREFVSKKGEEPSHIYIITKGEIDLLLTGKGGVIKKRQFNVGDCFGEAAMLSMINNTASFVAVEDSDLIVLSREALDQLQREDIELYSTLIMNLATELARKLQYTDAILLRHEHALAG